jgi:photosystem II stability/assembly factor-like uncharacterized protein
MHLSTFHLLFLIFSLTFSYNSYSQVLTWNIFNSNTGASFRAASVADDSVAWIAGTNGWIGRTLNGGNSWSYNQVPGFEKLDFRSLYAHDEKNAVIANAGYPANILVTNDGGRSWKTVFILRDSAAFIDGIDFWNRNEGIIYGDPMNSKMFLLRTNDGGNTWIASPDNERPTLNEGEASFAASGTNIKCLGKSTVVIATGGITSRLWKSEDKGRSWSKSAVPIIQGKPTTGIFSVAINKKNAVVVGGDYIQDTLKLNHVFITKDGGKTWMHPDTPTRGYRECVQYLDSQLLIATGPTGTEISLDGGLTWRPESDEKYLHVVRKARKGDLIVIAGGQGKVGTIKLK